MTVSRADLDLTWSEGVERFLQSIRPDQVILAAGRVGGIAVNRGQPAEFIYENLMIQANLIHGAWKAGVSRLLNFGSSCMYPRDCPQPMHPVHLMGGPLEPTSEPYAIAKWAGMTMCSSYNRQYGTRFITAIPTTIYGPGDCFDPVQSHVVSGLIFRFHEAKEQGVDSITLWGSGTSRREFVYVEDAAEACELLLDRYEQDIPVNIGTGESIQIRQLASLIAQVVGFQGAIRWDPSQPDGAPEKRLDSTVLQGLGWSARTTLWTGLEQTYRWFLEHSLCVSL